MKIQLLKNLSLYCIILIVLNGCMSTTRLNFDNDPNNDKYIHEINEKSKKNSCTLHLRNGKKIHRRNIYLTQDSLFIFDNTNLVIHDQETFQHRSFDSTSAKYSNDEIKKIIYKDRISGGFKGIVSGIGLGFLFGYGIGFIIDERNKGSEDPPPSGLIGMMLGIAGGAIGGVTGIITGISMGDNIIYEFNYESNNR